MKFPNAFKGISRIYTSEILNLIIVLLGGASAAIRVGSISPDNIELGKLATATLYIIIMGVLTIIALVFKLIGLNNAGMDEKNLKNAFTLSIAGLAVALLSPLFSNNAVISGLLKAVSSAIGLGINLLVIQGIISLAKQYGNDALVAKGQRLYKIIACFYIIAIVLELIDAFVGGNKVMNTISSILAIVAAILMIVEIVLYLKYLSAAKKMLAE